MKLILPILAMALSGCAHLHHTQVGQVDNRSSTVAIPFEIKVSETGVAVEEAGKIARAANTKGGDNAAGLATLISLFQMGPRTGNPVYDARYAEKVVYQIHEKCPSGNVTGLMSIRETRKYPVISGEIIKITGYCLKAREPASVNEEPVLEGEI
ncbi:MAG: hypothetical protein V4760_06765 [Bdellovibrionota bacterium]